MESPPKETAAAWHEARSRSGSPSASMRAQPPAISNREAASACHAGGSGTSRKSSAPSAAKNAMHAQTATMAIAASLQDMLKAARAPARREGCLRAALRVSVRRSKPPCGHGAQPVRRQHARPAPERAEHEKRAGRHAQGGQALGARRGKSAQRNEPRAGGEPPSMANGTVSAGA